MKKLFSSNILKIVLIVVFIIPSFLLTFFMAYIMLAPDNWPKPFYLSYQYSGDTVAESTNSSHEETATESSSHEATSSSSSSHGEEGEVVFEEPDSPAPSALLEIRPGQGIVIDTGTKIVNLAEPTGRQYIRVNVVLEYSPTDLSYYSMAAEEKLAYETGFIESIDARMPVINDGLISLLSSKGFEEVYTAEGKEHIRQEITEMLNTKIPEYRVIYVYFTEFVVQ